MTGNSGNLFCCIKGFKLPFEFQKGIPDCSGGAAGEKGLISRVRVGLGGVGNLVVFLGLRQEAWGSSRFLKVNSENLACCLRKSSLLSSCEAVHGITLQSLQGSVASFLLEGCISCYFSSCCLKLWVPIELQRLLLPQGSLVSF